MSSSVYHQLIGVSRGTDRPHRVRTARHGTSAAHKKGLIRFFAQELRQYPNSGCSPLAGPKRKTHFRPAHRFGMCPRKNRMSLKSFETKHRSVFQGHIELSIGDSHAFVDAR